jgi:ABC-type multidrug transport system ATPase subunit
MERVSLSEAATKKGSELSHGMAKRIGIAQALIGNPKVLFLDEPTAGLDPASSRQIKDLISSLAPEATLVVSSHNLAEIQEICTHGAILDHGKVTISGTIGDLTRQSGEITIEVQAGSPLPQSELETEFGSTKVSTSAVKNETITITISFSTERAVPDAIAAALKILLDANIGILGVQRGTSLESAFIELTSKSRGS